MTPPSSPSSDVPESTGHAAVAICTRNRPDKIGQAVESILALDHTDFTLTVIDQSTGPETGEIVNAIAERDPRVRYIHMDEAGLSKAYNTAVANTTGDIIAFTDDDCIAPPDWLTNVIAAFTADPELDLLYGQVVAAFPDDGGQELTPALNIDRPERLSKGEGFRVFGMGANYAARRRLFSTYGGFDEMLGGGGPLRSSQDFDLAYRIYKGGGVIGLRPEVVIRHDGRREREDWPALLTAYGIGDGAFYSKHVRCGDVYALWLLTKVLVRRGLGVAAKKVLRRPTDNGRYVAGVVKGIREGLRFRVDRKTRLYAQP